MSPSFTPSTTQARMLAQLREGPIGFGSFAPPDWRPSDLSQTARACVRRGWAQWVELTDWIAGNRLRLHVTEAGLEVLRAHEAGPPEPTHEP